MVEIIKTSKSKNDALFRIWGYSNKSTYIKLNKFIDEHHLSITHFDKELKYCLWCGELIKKNRNKFCDSSCAAKYNNSNRKHSKETKEKISKSVKKNRKQKTHIIFYEVKQCKNCGYFLTYLQIKRKNIYCSHKCKCSDKEFGKKISKRMQKRINDGLHHGWATRNNISYPEKFFINVLKNHNIKYKHNFPIKQNELGLDSSYNYFLDFYIKDKKIDLEIDGSQHKYRKEQDIKRDKLLNENGYNVYRIKWKNINTKKGKEYIKNEIDKFLEYYNKL